ncbi:CDP diacylglycerol serine [Encephalitozoon romaleae SJ-2008]|uniref:CDP-diacylglycerol--glycerol-3-phosphate 3-phosphatidyltransferase n=1 Tax=Encephalitozoon romaleae (strain SJ-2008) TaxID=1178016 RepID=I7AQ99_ENCRO|nr:CDP diacylglycerol serine [Encephalitozoon romaleae SJ-2008]AFN84054.1 CDP diacylglycerol serine [Encephalitozoon romaleae SJ-2008]
MNHLNGKSKKLDSVHVSDFRLLGDCTEFYQRIKFLLQTSESVYMASLFFGQDGEMEDILDILEEKKRRGLITVIFIDKNRGAAGRRLEFIQERGLESTFHLIDLSTSCLFPAKLNELFRVFHTKALVFDDITILSGANMDASYMVNRIDRYLEIQSKELTDMIKTKVFGVELSPDVESTPIQNLPIYVRMFKQQEEQSIVRSFLRSFGEIHISTGYLNFPDNYLKMFKGRRISLYASCPDRNRFNSFGIMDRFVGPIYSYSFHRTLECIPTLSIYELNKKGYSFHLKGFWGFKDKTAATIIGSSNFNRRSTERDDETNYLIVTSDPGHIQKLREEVEYLRANSNPRSLKQLRKRTYRLIVIILFLIFNRFF